ncbi:hypothetical protein GLOTRDRAFT_111697 [Gloeophyllum trabeum ATCC 11539]|uniref:Uncharacterized protein n=1 Tax=Gloeophyllum trabeum (strain ATCC 11539 / FP-39264 / Madison 617) TaxID=670483 RepID=S7Q0T9_GLOTA|nr:uncharacterized protein GLOTRDRAFT_111697 [Gloeophyllum trabeum ATCC 11539]EPQ53546.1 hypothetical protein GLOTRDRAFT_111697 [Gloeophyllum trabeum ATCC 11539]
MSRWVRRRRKPPTARFLQLRRRRQVRPYWHCHCQRNRPQRGHLVSCSERRDSRWTCRSRLRSRRSRQTPRRKILSLKNLIQKSCHYHRCSLQRTRCRQASSRPRSPRYSQRPRRRSQYRFPETQKSPWA